MQQDVKTIRPQQLRSSYFGFYSAVAGTETNSLQMSGALSFEDLVWLANTHIKAVSAGTAATGTITSSSVANPTVITTSAPHNLTSGDSTTIAGHTGSTPTINGVQTVTVTGASTFTIPVNVSVGGTGGTFTKANINWAFLPTSASDDIKSALIQIGYSDGIGSGQPAAQLPYCLGDELTLKWEKTGDGLVTFDSKMVTPSALTQISAFTGSLSNRTVHLATADTTTVKVDATTIGTTADNYWIDATWTLNNGFKNLYTLNGTTAAQDTFRPTARVWKLDGSRYYGGTVADTEWDAYIAKTPRKIRINTTGASLGGAAYGLTLDVYGVYTNMTWAEVDGLGVQRFTLEPLYDTTATTDFRLDVVSSESAMT